MRGMKGWQFAVSVVFLVCVTAQADEASLAKDVIQDLGQIQSQVIAQLVALYGRDSGEIKRFRKGLEEAEKPDIPRETSARRKVRVFEEAVNKSLQDLYGKSQYSVPLPREDTSLEEVSGKIMTKLIQRVEDIEIVLRKDLRHEPKER